MKFTDAFEKVFIISLNHREERRQRLKKALVDFNLVDLKKVEWVRAVAGNHCPPPNYFAAGNGAWGCLQSHLRIVQDASMDELSSILILEDDAVFHPKTLSLFERFMKEVPEDWEQLYLGGQHIDKPLPVDYRPFVNQCNKVHRTHAYALKAKVFASFQKFIMQAPDYMTGGQWHFDHQLGKAHKNKRWKTYSPAWWLVGQGDGSSDISGNANPILWWHSSEYSRQLPMIILPSDIELTELKPFAQYLYWDGSRNREQLSISATKNEVETDSGLGNILQQIAQKALTRGLLPCFYFPGISNERLNDVWGSAVLNFRHVAIQHLFDYPFNGIFPHALNGNYQQPLDKFYHSEIVG